MQKNFDPGKVVGGSVALRKINPARPSVPFLLTKTFLVRNNLISSIASMKGGCDSADWTQTGEAVSPLVAIVRPSVFSSDCCVIPRRQLIHCCIPAAQPARAHLSCHEYL